MPRPSATPAIDVEALVTVALRILGDYGLADLSMRRVAKELHVQPSALYWHVADKQSLLALVADRLLADVPAADLTGDVTTDVHVRTMALHRTLLATRDGAELVASVIALGTGGARLRSLLAEAAVGRTVLAEAVLALLLGSTLVVQQRLQAEQLGLSVPGGGPGGPEPEFSDLLELVLGSALASAVGS